MPLVRAVEEDSHEKRLAILISKHEAHGFTAVTADLNLCCGGDHIRKEWFTSYNEYRARDIYFEIMLQQCVAGKFSSFVGWHNVEVLSIPPFSAMKVRENT